jgi:hypothetical protein
MKFKPGKSGNPLGRPKGSPNKYARLSQLLELHAENILNKSVELALSGDTNALRMCIERLLPKVRAETISFNLPELDLTKAGALIVIGSCIIEAVSSGLMTPEQGKILSDIVDAQRKNIEISNLEARLDDVEYVLKIRN